VNKLIAYLTSPSAGAAPGYDQAPQAETRGTAGK